MTGIMDILYIPLGYVIKVCYQLVGNYALALLLFAIIIKIILFPLGIKQQKNSVKQASLRPKEMAIRKKYAGREDKATKQKCQEEVMALYQKENYNPMGGCFPLLIEMPVILALYKIITQPMRYICGISAEAIGQITERVKCVITGADSAKKVLSQIDVITHVKEHFADFTDLLPENFAASDFPDFTMFGGAIDLSATPSFNKPGWLLLIPLLTFLFTFGSMKLTRRFTYQPPTDGQSADTKVSSWIMDLMMPAMSTWITLTVPAVIGVYWIYQNILNALRQMLMYKLFPIPKFTEEDYKAAEREYAGKVKKNKGAVDAIKQSNPNKKVRSLHYIDAEDDADDSAAKDGEPAAHSPEKPEAGFIEPAPLKDDGKSKDKGK